jgi:hypothetical protein
VHRQQGVDVQHLDFYPSLGDVCVSGSAASQPYLTTKVPRLLGALKVAAPVPSVVVVTAMNRGVVWKDDVTLRNLGPRAPAPPPGPTRPAEAVLPVSEAGAGAAASATRAKLAAELTEAPEQHGDDQGQS